MAATTEEYTGNGSKITFTFTFPYLKQEDVKVSVDGTNTTEYTFPTATSIQFNSGHTPADQAKILIYRKTDVDTVKAVFSSGSSYRATDLNNNFDQSLYFSQEVADSNNPLISNSSDFVLDQSAKTDGSVIYYSSSASKFKADTTQTLQKIVDGGSF